MLHHEMKELILLLIPQHLCSLLVIYLSDMIVKSVTYRIGR